MLFGSRAITNLLSAGLTLVAAPACSDPSSDGRLMLQLANASQAVVIPFGCATSCPVTTLGVSVVYPSGAYNPRDTMELKQFRIDYEIAGSKLELPYYAEPISVKLSPDETQALTLMAAGAAQRSMLDEHQADLGGSAAGTATLQLAGYDWDNRQVFVHADFDVQFTRAQQSGQSSDDKTTP